MTVIDRSTFFADRQIENEIWRIEREAHRQIDQLVASTKARSRGIEASLKRIEADLWVQRPCDTEPSEDQVA